MSFLDTSCFYLHQTSTYSVLLNLLYDDDGHFENVQKRKEINSLSNAKDQMPKVLTLVLSISRVAMRSDQKFIFRIGNKNTISNGIIPRRSII